jgi:endonuclease/exonuclease/phosphatase family metal-dependent hydrolase
MIPNLNMSRVQSTKVDTTFDPWLFNKDTGKWMQTEHPSSGTHVCDTLKIVTYNVWFDKRAKKERMHALMNICKVADIICLQEVTLEFLNWVLQEDWVQNGVYISDVSGDTMNSYGVLILSRVPVEKFTLHILPTFMERKFLVAHLKINDETVQIGTIHLESLNNAPIRRKQLGVIQTILNKETSLFMGDFNFDATSNYQREDVILENDSLKELFPNHLDLWDVLNPDDKGYTFDPQINTMLRGFHRSRLDRIMMLSKTWRAISIEILGNTSFLGGDGVLNFPSDHFGLMTEIIKI